MNCVINRCETVDESNAAVAGARFVRFGIVGLRGDADQQDFARPHRSRFLLRSDRVLRSPRIAANHRQVFNYGLNPRCIATILRFKSNPFNSFSIEYD